MIRTLGAISILALLAACGDGQPFFNEGQDETTDEQTTEEAQETEDEDLGVDGDRELPPGTNSPTSTDSIYRTETLNEEDGGGYVTEVAYNAADDTFFVDNIGFDGDNIYTRDDAVTTLSQNGDAVYAVYEASSVVNDGSTGDQIEQLEYRAIYGVSANTVDVNGEILPQSQFAIVRTGSYAQYGFGGFVYTRNGAVELPTSGQAFYTGDYAGMRVFNGAGGLHYVNGLMDVSVDFEDFNDGSAVKGIIYDRQYFDIDGNQLNIGEGIDEYLGVSVQFAIEPGVLDSNGEVTGELGSFTVGADGSLEAYESGTYYAIIGGDNANEIVGIVVMEADIGGVTAQETGGFILVRE
ncbi:hypothetical protein JQU17_05410 [Ponticoccus sp. SC2-23]|uniref:hypothetical protein n=1 Tax=Alexandriicola marinus TaxID=2081710 RepID=UPI000FD7F459|nr:hypothetical protein [Alexandriicola marinus]MBM1219627.1 hypothetical protein [Ponticoccus sp. SC6-9]MBM1223301.1 hypothetical protein [Ponticoccus sp. SC6-15]MBM1229440.1 hypothetical protein [Ponticoccus sp. SC6-38]MBM1232267.1 hypothetical protein [Ponticoccus sp. SC6-45]MBM1237783.1 hypothetical protein [Ponticoccus sp. SC6-49]MBM1241278.1 hypothetical protein [Ponticoccus sp. SC2-64]MBM1245791.1 hypothetical protein [Ponticoccus sp. SC6-42]MBM1250269.1 hypothetical protein [Pontico